MFKRLRESAREVHILVDGRHVVAREGDTVAAALLAAGLQAVRTSAISATPRAPFCMIGACFDCLVEIDGVGNRQACMVEVRDGMAIAMQRGRRDLQR